MLRILIKPKLEIVFPPNPVHPGKIPSMDSLETMSSEELLELADKLMAYAGDLKEYGFKVDLRERLQTADKKLKELLYNYLQLITERLETFQALVEKQTQNVPTEIGGKRPQRPEWAIDETSCFPSCKITEEDLKRLENVDIYWNGSHKYFEFFFETLDQTPSECTVEYIKFWGDVLCQFDPQFSILKRMIEEWVDEHELVYSVESITALFTRINVIPPYTSPDA